MPILNYTTQIDAAKTVMQIQQVLVKHGASSILMNYAQDGSVEALCFKVATRHGDTAFRLPVDPDSVLRVMEKQNLPPRYTNREQAVRVAWRIVKDWIEAQMAILEAEMVKMEQIFLPYMIVADAGKTLYDAMVDAKFQLSEGSGEKWEQL